MHTHLKTTLREAFASCDSLEAYQLVFPESIRRFGVGSAAELWEANPAIYLHPSEQTEGLSAEGLLVAARMRGSRHVIDYSNQAKANWAGWRTRQSLARNNSQLLAA